MAPVRAWPAESGRDRVNATLGMILFIGSWTMAFGTLLLSFLVLRQRVGVWPPEGIALPSRSIAIGATVILLLSSVFVECAARLLKRNSSRASDLWVGEWRRTFDAQWLTGLALGIGFAAVQTWLWYDLILAGRTQMSGLFESLFFGLTWVHAIHVVIGLGILAWAYWGIRRGRYGIHRTSFITNAALFWHFVGVVWLLVFLGFFVF